LACLLIDDAGWARMLPDRFLRGVAASGVAGGLALGILRTGLAALVLVVSGVKFWQNLSLRAYPPAVARLLGRVEPFRRVNRYRGHPPTFIRAQLYDYRFTTPEERKATGAWWSRRLVGAYSPVVRLVAAVPTGL